MIFSQAHALQTLHPKHTFGIGRARTGRTAGRAAGRIRRRNRFLGQVHETLVRVRVAETLLRSEHSVWLTMWCGLSGARGWMLTLKRGAGRRWRGTDLTAGRIRRTLTEAVQLRQFLAIFQVSFRRILGEVFKRSREFTRNLP